MRVKVIVSLIFVCLLILFALFNRQPVEIYILSFSLLKTSLSNVVFWSFIAGAVYAVVMTVLSGIKMRGTISRQKKLLKELESRSTD